MATFLKRRRHKVLVLREKQLRLDENTAVPTIYLFIIRLTLIINNL